MLAYLHREWQVYTGPSIQRDEWDRRWRARDNQPVPSEARGALMRPNLPLSSRFPTGRYNAAWWTLYESAILELDEEKMQRRIATAMDAIKARSTELGFSGTDKENSALVDAMNALRVLQHITERKKWNAA